MTEPDEAATIEDMLERASNLIERANDRLGGGGSRLAEAQRLVDEVLDDVFPIGGGLARGRLG